MHTLACRKFNVYCVEAIEQTTHTNHNPSSGLNTADTMTMARLGWTFLGLVCEHILSQSQCLAVFFKEQNEG